MSFVSLLSREGLIIPQYRPKVFEFICAQAPRTSQGLLLVCEYATFSIRYLE